MAKQPRAIGIDLGTTNSCAAVMDGARPRVITYKGGGSTIPSVFAIDEKGNQLVGIDAKRQAQLNPSNTVMASKRLIGRNFHSKTIDQVKQVFTYEMLEGENNEVLIKVKGEIFTLEQISAAILSKIKEVAEESLSEDVEQAVITVPAYFNDRQRQAVRNAGKMAGLKVLRILNEPTAAALAYGLGKNLSQRIAVYDLGGGTFDISVIDITDRVFEVIATGGDTFLGGVDFDRRLMKHILERFLEEHGVDLSWDRVAIQRIRDAAETAKIELSTRSTTRIQIPYIARTEEGAIDIDVELTRAQLESLTRDLIERTLATCDRIFSHAGTTKDDIQEVLLVGGQSRMPLVQQMVADFMGRPPSKGVHPDEAVGIGAAIMAHSLSGGSAADVSLLDVLPIPIGISKVDGSMHVLFQKNERLPASKTRTLTTSKTNQRSILLRIYQGESRMVAENELLGTFVFSKIRPAAKGEVQIEVNFFIDSEGILNLTARDKETNQTVESTLKLNQTKPKKKAEPEAAAPEAKPRPLSPFNMPLSSLMQDIGGGNDGEDDAHATPEPHTDTRPAPELHKPVAPVIPVAVAQPAPAEEPRGPLAPPVAPKKSLWQRFLGFFGLG
jgi:molecular chaperone DnaK